MEFYAATENEDIQEAEQAFITLIEETSPCPEGYVLNKTYLESGTEFEMALVSDQPASFGTFDTIPNVEYVRTKLAVTSEFKDNIRKCVKYSVKDGVILPIYNGPVGPQIVLITGRHLPDGGTRILILVDKSEIMNYIEIVSEREVNNFERDIILDSVHFIIVNDSKRIEWQYNGNYCFKEFDHIHSAKIFLRAQLILLLIGKGNLPDTLIGITYAGDERFRISPPEGYGFGYLTTHIRLEITVVCWKKIKIGEATFDWNYSVNPCNGELKKYGRAY